MLRSPEAPEVKYTTDKLIVLIILIIANPADNQNL